MCRKRVYNEVRDIPFSVLELADSILEIRIRRAMEATGARKPVRDEWISEAMGFMGLSAEGKVRRA